MFEQFASAVTSQLVQGAVLAIVFSAAVRSLPKPKPMGNQFYGWFYRFTNLLLANLDLARKDKN